MCKNCITLSGLKAEDSFQSLTQVKYIYKKKKRKKTCIHLLLQDSQTCRHPTLPSPLSTRVERSVGSDRLPPNPIKMTPNLLPSFQKKQANVSSPHEKRKKKILPGLHAVEESHRSPIQTAQRRTADTRRHSPLSAYRRSLRRGCLWVSRAV